MSQEKSLWKVSELCALFCLDSIRSSHQSWHFSSHLGLHFTAVMSWWDSFALAQVSPILSSNHWPTCWPKMSDLLCGSLINCGTEHVKPGGSWGSLQKQLLYSKSRCFLNKENTVSFHIISFAHLVTFEIYCRFFERLKIFSYMNSLLVIWFKLCHSYWEEESPEILSYIGLSHARDAKENLKITVI